MRKMMLGAVSVLALASPAVAGDLPVTDRQVRTYEREVEVKEHRHAWPVVVEEHRRERPVGVGEPRRAAPVVVEERAPVVAETVVVQRPVVVERPRVVVEEDHPVVYAAPRVYA